VRTVHSARPIESVLDELGFEQAMKDAERYNIAPTQQIPIVTGERKAVAAKWGLVPSWAEDPKIASRMINARGEGIAEKPAFRSAFKRDRCLVLADGFYESRR
jgi:putative SOS response-associated peptidase YedK